MQQLNLLIVEDSESDAGLTARKIESGGYAVSWTRVDTAIGLQAALDREPWDALICDYSMPAFGGLEALAIVQARQLDVPFLFVSGVMGEDTAVAAMKAGAHDYVTKANLTRLVPAIERELREAVVRKRERQTLQALGESEEKFRALTEESLVGVYLIQYGRFQYVNQTFANILGYTPDELLNLPSVLDSVSAPDRARVAENMRRRLAGEINILRCEFTVVRKDGERRQVEVLGSSTVLAGQPALLGTAEDITERQRLEGAQKRHAEELEHFNRLAVGRELRMIQLKGRINELSRLLGQPAPYALDFAEDLITPNEPGPAGTEAKP